METCRRRFPWVIAGCLLTLAFLVNTGCRRDEQSFEIITLEGKVEKIDVRPDGTGEITVAYFSEKHGQEMIGTGLVTKETEIMISGAVAALKDVREGEQIRGEVRVEKTGDRKRRIALKIHIDRAQPVTDGGR